MVVLRQENAVYWSHREVMKYKILNEIPGRMRIHLAIPHGFSADGLEINDYISGIDGVNSASFNQRIKSLLVKHRADKAVRDAVLKAIEEMPYSRLQKKRRKDAGLTSLQQKKKAVIKSAVLLLASPLIPLPLKPFIAVYGAIPIFKKGLKAVFRRKLSIDVLDSSAISVAIGMKAYRTAGIITLLLKVGDYLDEWTRSRFRKMLTGMFSMDRGGNAWIRTESGECMIMVDELKKGDSVIVRTGSRIPVDGVVIEGEAMVNQSSMTGEPLPVRKSKGISVYAETTIEEGMLVVKALSVGSDTRVAKIVKVIEESEGLKADVQSHAEQLAGRLVPYTFLASGLTYAFTGNLFRAASVLLVDYSCAIKLSVPLAVMSGMLRAAKKGVLIKGGRFIERLSSADVFVLDKTGTLTEATPGIMAVIPFNGYDRDYILKQAACVEEHFPHPVARAVVEKARDEGIIHEEDHTNVEYVAAHGIASRVSGKRILVGSRHFIEEDEGINTGVAEKTVNKFAAKGHSVLYVAINDKLAGIIAIEDPLRNDSLMFLKKLNALGIKRIIMLTGDAEASAKNVAKRLGIKEYYAQMLPDTKTEMIKRLKREGNTVVMVGDGINDSPAIAHADVGISMKHGADIAKEVCDVLLLDGNLTAIIDTIKISRKAMSLIKKNFGYTVWINSSLIGLGLLGALPLAVSAFTHNAATIAVIMNSLRLMREEV